MTTNLEKAVESKEQFNNVTIKQIPRDENSHADTLANLDSAIQVTESKNVPIIYLKWPTVWKQE